MTLPMTEPLFAGLSDPATAQAYDTPQGRAEAVEAFARKARQAAGDAGAQALGDWLHSLAGDLDRELCALVAQVLPLDAAEENSDYVLEHAEGTRVGVQAQLARLGAGREGTQAAGLLRLSNVTLEQRFQALLDHLTAKRITEEMDTPTYTARLRGAFKRVQEGAAAQGHRFALHLERIDRVKGRVGIIRDLGQLLEQMREGQPGAEEAIAALRGRAGATLAFVDHLHRFAALSHDSLTRIHSDFAAQANIDGVRRETVLVSREIERSALFRPLPLFWAVFVTFLVKIVLAHNTSLALHDLAVPVLGLSFVATWLLSIYLGIWARASRMRALQAYTRDQLAGIVQARAAGGEMIEFPAIPEGYVAPPRQRVLPYAHGRDGDGYRGRIVLRNLTALVIPALLAVVVMLTRAPGDRVFIARFDGAQACVLATGRMVFTTPASFFVLQGGAGEGALRGALNRVFPEFSADAFSRGRVIRVGAPGDAAGLRGCAQPGPPSAQTDPAGGRTALTVDLGETSLAVLAQVGAGAPRGPLPAPLPAPLPGDPVMVQARAAIALELSKPEPGQIDMGVIVAALDTIRAHVDVNLSLAEALALAYALPPAQSPQLVLPDALLAVLERLGEGGDGLSRDVAAMVAALERLGTIAQGFDPDSGAVVNALEQNLSALAQGNAQSAAALHALLSAGQAGPVVIAPSVFAPDITGGGGGAGGPVSAHLFQTTVQVSDPDIGPTTLANTLVLPFFTAPVRNGDAGLATPQGAFDWGADVAHLVDPPVTDAGLSYFGRIAQTLSMCLAGNATVEMDLIGLASPSWDGPTRAAPRGVLNYHLAEGRRIGALRRLGQFMPEAEQARVLVQVAQGQSAPMSELLDRVAQEAGVAEFLPRFGRFGSAEAFETRRDTLLAVTSLNPQIESPLEELFGRSVVLQMLRSEGGPCAF